MGMDLLALLLFLTAIILAFIRHVNIGIVALAMGVIGVRIFGLTDKDLISGISSGMFCTLVGITLLFSIIKQTGALDLLAQSRLASPHYDLSCRLRHRRRRSRCRPGTCYHPCTGCHYGIACRI